MPKFSVLIESEGSGGWMEFEAADKNKAFLKANTFAEKKLKGKYEVKKVKKLKDAEPPAAE